MASLGTGKWKGQRGTSLVEVLVVMVVLLVGIFTIVRLFPIGFTNLRHTENRTVAHRLAAAQLEWWKNNAEKLPDAVASVDPTVVPFGLALDPTNAPTDMETKLPPEDAPLPNELRRESLWSGVNKTRRILGEVTKIPAPIQTEKGPASLYFLSMAPIEFPREAFSNPDKYLLIYGADLLRSDITGLGDLERQNVINNLGARQYAVDYRRGSLYFNGTGYAREYRVTYSFPTQFGLRSVTGEIVQVPRRPRGFPTEVRLRFAVANPGPSGNAIEPFSERVARKFRNVGSAPFTSDEYEYRTLAQGGGYADAIQQITGGIIFNPAGYKAFERGPRGLRPLTAHIDYTVADWHVIHEDRVVPETSPFSVKLSLPFVKRAGESSEIDGSTYRGLLDSFMTPSREDTTGLGPSVVAVNLATGGILADGGASFGVYGGAGNLAVDYKEGIVRFANRQGDAWTPLSFRSAVNVASLGGGQVPGAGVRIFYRAEDDWAVTLQKAPTEYHQVIDESRGGFLPFGRFYVGRVEHNFAVNRLWVPVLFPIADAGKDIIVSYSYTARDGLRKTVHGEQYRIGEMHEAIYPYGATNLLHPHLLVTLPEDADPRAAAPAFHQVRGCSVRSVVLWRDGERWKRAETSTFMTRSEI